MIADTLQQIHLYKGLMGSLDTAIDYLTTTDLTSLPLGKTVIGEDAFVIIFDNTLTEGIINDFEMHREYGDIHLTLNDQEWVYCTPLDRLRVTQAYDSSGDSGLGQADVYAGFLIDPTHFVIAFPNDAHSVKNFAGSRQVKKAVIKFKIQGK